MDVWTEHETETINLYEEKVPEHKLSTTVEWVDSFSSREQNFVSNNPFSHQISINTSIESQLIPLHISIPPLPPVQHQHSNVLTSSRSEN